MKTGVQDIVADAQTKIAQLPPDAGWSLPGADVTPKQPIEWPRYGRNPFSPGPTAQTMTGRFWYTLVMGWGLAVRYARTRAATIAKHREVGRRLAFLDRLIPRS